MDTILNTFAPFLSILSLVSLGVYLSYWLLFKRHSELAREKMLTRQIIQLFIVIVGGVVVVLALPVSESLRNQVLALMGILASGIIALSSTTIISNLMAGLLLRFTNPFKIGDFVRLDGYFGRITEMGLFDTEVQTDRRDLISFPNSYIINHPVSVVRTSGAIISASVSLGYDVHHQQVEKLLLQAATACALENPYVQIVELKDHAIVYKINGLLPDVKGLMSNHTSLLRQVLDVLHEHQVEIVSPAFMNQRRVSEEPVIPRHQQKKAAKPTAQAEEIVFDKADEAQAREQLRAELKEELEAISKAKKSAESDQQDPLKAQYEKVLAALKALDGQD